MLRIISLLLVLLVIELCATQSITCTAKNKCLDNGGTCQPKGSECTGKIRKGKKYCEEYQSCECCEPKDCSKDRKKSCEVLNGKCIGIDDFCNGTSVTHKLFCKDTKTCKCCFPDCVCDVTTCTYNNQDGGRCSRYPLPDMTNVGPQECTNGCECYMPDVGNNNCDNERKCERHDAEGEGYYPTGHCRKVCHDNEVPSPEKCDINPLGSCQCCLRKKDECPNPYCEVSYDGQLIEGKCRLNGCIGSEESDGYCPNSNCQCCINTPQVCEPATCSYNNQDGRCSRYWIPGWINVGPQECQHGCDCYIPEDNNDCDEHKCERPNAVFEGYNPWGYCRKECYSSEREWDKCDLNQHGDCKCCLRKQDVCPKPTCTAVYQDQLYEGICRISACLSMEIRADFCSDSNCNCCINVTEVCEPSQCTFKDIYTGDCLREQPVHTVEVSAQGCKDGCNCYVNNTMCGPPCTSVNPLNCKCYDGPCPAGTCFHDTGLCKGCTCCELSECKSKNELCVSPDFCVDKYDDNYKICPKGFVKVYNTCFKNSDGVPLKISDNKIPPPTSVDCDCCKSLACKPIGKKCSGKGAYCIDSLAVCPWGFKTTYDCSKPVVVNGVVIASKLCKCCTPDLSPPCESFKNQCSAKEDYCIEKNGLCQKGYGRIYNGCYKKFIAEELPIDKSANLTFANDCDCCKKLGCTSNGDACTSPGSYCIEPEASCPLHYDETNGCHKPVIVNGVQTLSQLCKCCKPNKIVAIDDDLQVAGG